MPPRRGPKRQSELSNSQASGWRQLSLNFGGVGCEGRERVENREEEGGNRGQARRRTQIEPSSTKIRSAAPPGADPSRSDGKGPPSGLV
jgi:hypothetical protein